MIQPPQTVTLKSAEETTVLAARLGAVLHPGDCLLLDGPIGAGKTHFCRSLIQSVLQVPEDVPSPTFTLVQTYDTQIGELWHADLYRLSNLDEIEELGLTEAFDTAICLVEWSEKLGSLAPNHALKLGLRSDAEHEMMRHLTLEWTATRWSEILGQLLQ
ncbi:MAG: tRNA (adenosine(37)-N6)-threonylcarbamoyltransferase complex ATPase subunit type 1 TsaE [Rhodobacteraceae bacterium]|nr:tRNA (adenosine(37)-N6)-threonylcarbamoyltransferase complex ATPase subunit type 1 TsaE [Paracoccaceae bacterium]